MNRRITITFTEGDDTPKQFKRLALDLARGIESDRKTVYIRGIDGHLIGVDPLARLDDMQAVGILTWTLKETP